MSTTYDWSPVFQAAQGLGQRFQYQKALEAMLGGQAQTGVPQQPQQNPAALPTPPMTVNPGSVGGAALPPINVPSVSSPPLSPTPSATGNQSPAPNPYASMLPMLKMLSPEQGMPLLLQMAMRRPEYDATPHDGINPDTGKRGSYIIDKNTGTQHWLNSTPETKAEFVNGQAVDPYSTAPGTTIPLQDRVKIAGGMQSVDGGKTWTDIPGYTAQQKAIAAARAAAKAPKPPNPNAPITLVHPSSDY